MRITTTQQPVAVACLQAQHIADLPAAAEGRQVLLRLLQQPTAAAATCRGGVAVFHDQVLLLHCAPVVGSGVVTVAVTVGRSTTAVNVDLAEQLRRPTPSVLSFVLGGGASATTAGAVLSLTLHHRLVTRPAGRRPCACVAADLLLSCLNGPSPPAAAAAAQHNGSQEEEEDDGESSGFITIEKGTISRSRRRRPPSDNLLTTDDEEVDSGIITKPSQLSKNVSCCWSSLDSKLVEDQFLAMLDGDGDGDLLDLDLEALVEDAEAELAGRPRRASSEGAVE